MPKFRIAATATALIEEIWEVEASSAAEARDLLFAGTATFISQSVLGDEENREVETMECDGEELPADAWFETGEAA